MYKKLINHFFKILCTYVKLWTGYYQKNEEKFKKKRLVKGTKMFLKKEKSGSQRYQNLFEEEKDKKR